jgi:hypothetical protein
MVYSSLIHIQKLGEAEQQHINIYKKLQRKNQLEKTLV